MFCPSLRIVPRWGRQPVDHAQERGLAGTGPADHADHLSLGNGKGDTVHRGQVSKDFR